MILYGEALRAIHETVSFRGSWNGRCDECQVELQATDLCWAWVDDFLSPMMHTRCIEVWVRNLPVALGPAFRDFVDRAHQDLDRGRISYTDLSGLREMYERTQRRSLRELLGRIGGFDDYVNHWDEDESDPATRLNQLYNSITIWEVYKRLMPNKPHASFNPAGDTRCACPHESGRNSLSMTINDKKGVYFCFHSWSGNNKMALYCEIRGISNKREDFHKLKRLMVFELRGENPYLDRR